MTALKIIGISPPVLDRSTSVYTFDVDFELFGFTRRTKIYSHKSHLSEEIALADITDFITDLVLQHSQEIA